MNIGLDYDKTYSAAPALFDHFIDTARDLGHDIRIVTIRDERFDRTAPLITLERVLPVIYCRGVAKAFWCLHHANFPVDIWVDDRPETITHNSETTPEDLAAWRAERGEPV